MATAVASLLGFLFKHRGAVQSPDVEWRHPLRSSLRLFRSPVYALGMAVAMGSWALHVGALTLAPISLVQTVIAGGLVLLTVLANRVFGHDVSQREWVGVAMTAAGLAFLAATVGNTGNSAHSDFDPATLAAYLGLLTAAGTAAAVAGWQTATGASLVAAAAGCCGARPTSRSKPSAGRSA